MEFLFDCAKKLLGYFFQKHCYLIKKIQFAENSLNSLFDESNKKYCFLLIFFIKSKFYFKYYLIINYKYNLKSMNKSIH